MAARPQPLIAVLRRTALPALLPGAAAAAVLIVFGGSLAALVGAIPTEAGDGASLWSDGYLWHVVGVTVLQAVLSTVLSVALAVPVARALVRRRFPGRGLLLRLFGASLVMPVIVAIFGIVAVHGHGGWVNALLAGIGLGPRDYLYGLGGILLGHVFFDLPLAARIFAQALEEVPGETWRLADQLGMRPWAIFRLIDLPQLRRVMPGAAALIFLLSFLSFPIVLTLGGGPRWTTVEVAIYQALRFDFDIARAVSLALLQVALLGASLLLFGRAARSPPAERTGSADYRRPDARVPATRATDILALLLALLIVLPPLAAVGLYGLTGPVVATFAGAGLWTATLRSLVIAGASAGLALLLAAGLLTGERVLARHGWRRSAGLIEGLGSGTLLVSPLVLSTGLFLLVRDLGLGATLGGEGASVLTALVNACMALPYLMRSLGPSARAAAARYERLCLSLGIRGWHRLSLIEIPLLRPALGLSLAVAATLSLGDLGAMALFGTGETETLPLRLYRLLGSYRIAEGGVVALWLLVLTLGLFVVIERGVGGGRK